MNPEDRLRDLLRSSDVEPRGDGLAKIQARLVRRRRARLVLLPSAALAVTGAVVAVLALGGTSPDQTLTVQPGDVPTATATPSTQPSPAAVAATYDGPMVWPFATSPAPANWRTRYPWADQPKAVAQHFVDDFLGTSVFDAVPTIEDMSPPPGASTADYGVVVEGRRVSLLHLEPLGPAGPWTVASAEGTDVQLESPGFGESVGSPLLVKGRLLGGVDESFLLQLLTTSGVPLAQTSAMAGSEEPWSGELTFSDTSWRTGAVIGTTASAKDGVVTRLFVQPVVRGAVASPDQYAVLRAGHVELLDVTGRPARQLTFPPLGALDRALAYSSGRLLWVRQTKECDQSLLQLVGGKPSTLLDHVAGVRSPRLSADGRTSAWVEQDCGDGPSTVRVGSRALTGPEGGTVELLDVSDDGALLYRVVRPSDVDRVLYLPSGATSLDRGVVLVVTAGCQRISAATFDGGITAWESCKDGQTRLSRYGTDGNLRTADPFLTGADVRSAAATSQGQLLTLGNQAGGTTLARYVDGKLTQLSDCGNDDSCFSAADW